MNDLLRLEKEIINCSRCSRLRSYCKTIAVTKKREFRNETYWGLPVPGFGDVSATIWIMGLAPAAHGANRTGRMFTGDSSGRWLYRALYRVGWASKEESLHRDDGLVLKDIYISAAARCAPPDNKPLPSEIANCSDYLDREFRALKNLKLFLALGNIGYHAILGLLQSNKIEVPKPRPKFQHGGFFKAGSFGILMSYHPSRQNTQTGRLTEEMWNGIFDRAREITTP